MLEFQHELCLFLLWALLLAMFCIQLINRLVFDRLAESELAQPTPQNKLFALVPYPFCGQVKRPDFGDDVMLLTF